MSDALQNSRSSEVIAAAIATVAASGVVVALRFVTRIRILHFLGVEDWCILFAYVSSYLSTV